MTDDRRLNYTALCFTEGNTRLLIRGRRHNESVAVALLLLFHCVGDDGERAGTRKGEGQGGDNGEKGSFAAAAVWTLEDGRGELKAEG